MNLNLKCLIEMKKGLDTYNGDSSAGTLLDLEFLYHPSANLTKVCKSYLGRWKSYIFPRRKLKE